MRSTSCLFNVQSPPSTRIIGSHLGSEQLSTRTTVYRGCRNRYLQDEPRKRTPNWRRQKHFAGLRDGNRRPTVGPRLPSESQEIEREILNRGVSAFNALNHSNFTNHIGSIRSPLFRMPTTAPAAQADAVRCSISVLATRDVGFASGKDQKTALSETDSSQTAPDALFPTTDLGESAARSVNTLTFVWLMIRDPHSARCTVLLSVRLQRGEDDRRRLLDDFQRSSQERGVAVI
jgi:hypothetical protein